MPAPHRPLHVDAARLMLNHPSIATARGHAAATGRVYDVLLTAFSSVIGPAGFHALLARSIRLDVDEFPCLQEMQTQTGAGEDDGARLVRCLGRLPSKEALAVATELFATFLDITATFIGEEMVRRIVSSAFEGIDIGRRK